MTATYPAEIDQDARRVLAQAEAILNTRAGDAMSAGLAAEIHTALHGAPATSGTLRELCSAASGYMNVGSPTEYARRLDLLGVIARYQQVDTDRLIAAHNA